jgi:hypothetical protein
LESGKQGGIEISGELLLLLGHVNEGETEIGEDFLHVVTGRTLERRNYNGLAKFVQLSSREHIFLLEINQIGLESAISEVVMLELDLLGTVVIKLAQVNECILLALLNILIHPLHHPVPHGLLNQRALLPIYYQSILPPLIVPPSHEQPQQTLEFNCEVSEKGP